MRLELPPRSIFGTNPPKSPDHKPSPPPDMADQTAVELFGELGNELDIDPKVTSWLTSPDGLAAKSLDDLLYACNEDGIDKLIEAAKPPNMLLAGSRLRQAWRSLQRARDSEDVIKRSGHDTMDMDDLLAASVLDDIEARRWARYKMTWPPEIAPADTLISRIEGELEKRTLSVQMVFKVRTQAHQQRDVRKRTRVAEGLEMVSASVGRGAAPSLHNDMANLLTLLVAYSRAGSKLRADAPTAEPKTVDSTKVVECPLDVLMRYYYRVQDRAHALQYHMAVGWIQRKDEAERAVWVDRFRHSTESLGEIIQHTLQTREAMWELPTPEVRLTRTPGGGRPGAKRKPVPGAASKAPPVKPPPKNRAEALRDGTRLCLGFNQGKCTYSSRKCNYTHQCSVVKPNGDACGGRHSAMNHR